MDEKIFLGRGWSFPPSFDNKNLATNMSIDEQDIRESLFILLSTLPGERTMRPKYGCDLHSMVFAEMTKTNETIIIDLIESAILEYEPRITVEEVTIDSSNFLEGMININIEYTIRKINIRTNIVYPYYLIEGTDIADM